jgi:serine/threonine protein kinase
MVAADEDRTMPAETRSLKEIFLDALAIVPAQRAAWLAQECGGDADLRRHIELMLAAHDQPQSLIDRLSPEGATGALAAGDHNPGEPKGPEQAGTILGPYKLLEEIGEGGMGAVWMAEQLEPICRRVAVKVIKEGMDSKQVLARFEAERQALALMEHPNIARVLDAGRTPSGRPYFVMELVKGKPITTYCDDKRLGVRERLELFGDVCRAVQHAHQRGIIHRDLKPSNVLVAPYDGKPVVKVIDFGVAKATGQRLTDKTLFTGFGALVGTPEYMSPEQAQANNQDIDTRSDIYSLGVLLYELLTGSTPVTRKRLKEEALLEVLRVIREEEPPKPSTRLAESKDSLPSISAQRQTEPAKLTKLVRGELDWIVMKALEKDRNRRYESASAFAADLQHYLHDEPVQACPPSAWYRLRKYARRHRAALLTAGLVAAALVVGIGVASWQAIRASRAEEEKGKELAEKVKENRRANKNLRLALDGLEKIYGDLAEGELANVPHLEGLRKDYLQRLRDFFGEFARANREDPQAQLEAGKAYRRLASIEALLGQQAEAENDVQQAIVALQSQDDAGTLDVQFELAMSWFEYGVLLIGGPRGAEAEQYIRKALGMLTALPPSEDGKFLWAQGHVHLRLGDALQDLRRLPEAEDVLKMARKLFQQLTPDRFAGDPFVPRQRAALALHKLALVKARGKALKEAEVDLRRARDEMEPVLKARPQETQFQVEVAYLEYHLARLLQVTQRAGEAEQGFRRAFDLRLKLATSYPTVQPYRAALIYSLKCLDECLQQNGKPAERLALCETLVKDYPTVPEYQLALAHTLTNRAADLYSEKHLPQAEDLLRRALRLEEKLTLEDPDCLEQKCRTLQNLGWVLLARGRAEEAEKLMRANLELRQRWFAQAKDDRHLQVDPLLAAFYAQHARGDLYYDAGQPGDTLARSYCLLAQVLRPAHRWQEISDLYEEALKRIGDEPRLNNEVAWFLVTCPVAKFRDPARAVRLAEKAVAAVHKDPLQAANEGDDCNTLGLAHYRAGNWQAAVAALEQSRKLRRGGDVVDWLFLAMAHQKLGHPDEARKWYAQAVQWLEKNREALATDPTQSETAEEMDRFRREAEEVLGQNKK